MPNPPQVSILIVDDDDEYRSVVARRFERRGHFVEHTGSPAQALRLVQRRHFDVAILDVAMPEMDGVLLLERIRALDPETQAVMLTGHATVETAIRAMKLGAYDYLIKPCALSELEIQAQRAVEKSVLARENQALRSELLRVEPPSEIIGTSIALQEVMKLIHKAAPTDSTVLIQGESGTGKELVARSLHRGSARALQPMVVINCAALQESLLESELFGHERGAFTSAIAAKQGLFELAHRGTLFIDEIGEMSPGVQAKLLRAIEDGRIRRVGSTREITTDVRVLAATNRNLSKEVATGRFRPDLFYRLNVISITLPPLRDRAGDVPLLVRHFLTRPTPGPREIEPAALSALEAYPWPGNVRELANVLERAKILAEHSTIGLQDLPAEIVASAPVAGAAPRRGRATAGGAASLDQIQRDHVARVLEAQNWNKVKAADALGISRRKLYRLLDRLGLSNLETRCDP